MSPLGQQVSAALAVVRQHPGTCLYQRGKEHAPRKADGDLRGRRGAGNALDKMGHPDSLAAIFDDGKVGIEAGDGWSVLRSLAAVFRHGVLRIAAGDPAPIHAVASANVDLRLSFRNAQHDVFVTPKPPFLGRLTFENGGRA